jgi:hypothetical protein
MLNLDDRANIARLWLWKTAQAGYSKGQLVQLFGGVSE